MSRCLPNAANVITQVGTMDDWSPCCHAKEKSKLEILINIIEKISATALGAFSLYTNWQLFIPFFSAGVCIGIYSYTKDKKSCHQHHPVSSCAHGLLEELTGVTLPPIISTIANIAVTVCHIDHHATVFVPIVGVSLGNWIGKTAFHLWPRPLSSSRCADN